MVWYIDLFYGWNGICVSFLFFYLSTAMRGSKWTKGTAAKVKTAGRTEHN